MDGSVTITATSIIKEKLGSVRLQDVVITAVCALLVYLLGAKNQIILTPAWYHHFDAKHFENRRYPVDEERKPQPIVTDFDGDNKMEVVLISNENQLQVLLYNASQKLASKRLQQLQVKHSVVLPLEVNEYGEQEYPVAMETGYIDPYISPEHSRSQVIVVATNNWHVLCYSSTLQLLWQHQLMPLNHSRDHLQMTASALLVSAVKLHKNDQGAIFVGGAYGHKDHHARMKMLLDEQASRAMHQAGDLHTAPDDPTTHFSTFALSGSNGAIRWHHLPGDFETKRSKARVDSHHWKLNLRTHHEEHMGEVHWTKYGESFLQLLPHDWTSLGDTKFDFADLRKKELIIRIESSSALPLVDIIGESLDDYHISGVAYGGLGPHSHHEHIRKPNTLVVHNHKGVEVLDLHVGRPLTRLKVARDKSAYIDVNEDGTLERARLVATDDGCYGEVSTVHPRPLAIFSENVCSALQWWGSGSVFSRLPVAAEDEDCSVPPFFIKSIAVRKGFVNHLLGYTLPSERKGYDTLFLTSQGRLSSFAPNGDLNWQVLTPAQWVEQTTRNWRDPGSIHADVYNHVFKPSATPMSPKVYGRKSVALLLGWDTIALVDLRDGQILGEHSLPCQPIDKPVIADFTNDGQNDFIVTCSSGSITFSVSSEFPIVHTLVIGVFVVLCVLLMTWCCRVDKDNIHHEDMR
ncbi:hypothetical protein CAPTEDRAFT_224542 [Capitella teleta]|uniref:FG-GAP repeat-containing protein n=1 Tax=Capitella teleta TaxID=283909 RepID=R7TZV7_CAPTE|nr:hypothetical protein CAPTEDRAFT_224542 [Capitella teleta]|eukprot:ELT96931.1 hypothetical protein CAPTEDRAFT_224542 [Capitella teleta]